MRSGLSLKGHFVFLSGVGRESSGGFACRYRGGYAAPMSAGTKVTLALVAVLIVALVMYYRSLRPDPKQAMLVQEPPVVVREPEPKVEDDLKWAGDVDRAGPSGSAARSGRDEHVTAPAASGRFLGASVESALGGGGGGVADEGMDGGAGANDGAGGGSAELPEVDSVVEVDEQDDVLRDAESEVDEVGEEPELEGAPAPTGREQSEPPQYTEYTVKSGDTMSSISFEWFGTESRWDLIAKANPFVDPNRLRVGQVLRLPPRDAERGDSEGVSGETSHYVVRSGDSLSRIAYQYYGHENKWRIIYDANRAVLGNDPDNLRVGMKLEIPPAPQPAD